MKPLEELLSGIAALLQFGGEWHARAVGQQVYEVGATPREAVERALGLDGVDVDLF